jgi:hypothetical protein
MDMFWCQRTFNPERHKCLRIQRRSPTAVDQRSTLQSRRSENAGTGECAKAYVVLYSWPVAS